MPIMLALLAILMIFSVSKCNEFLTQENKIGAFYMQTDNDMSIAASAEYIPASTEQTIMDNLVKLKLHGTTNEDAGSGCEMWTHETEGLDLYKPLHAFLTDLKKYNELEKNFKVGIKDLREAIRKRNGDSESVCQQLRLHPNGLPGIFESGQLSLTSSGYVEPLLPPMRNPGICVEPMNYADVGYIIHDYEAMCKKLKSHSKIIFIDMGASLDFKDNPGSTQAMFISNQFEKYGFKFDHIYAFEITPHDPLKVFEKVPGNLFGAYHWINVGVSADRDNMLNPLDSILSQFTEDDLVVVKLDIDTPTIEIPLADQLLKSNYLWKVVDQFYFEHHVKLQELLNHWGHDDSLTSGSVKDSMELFTAFRQKGIAAHFWV